MPDHVILYLMVGYPGSGKTTTSRIIAEKTGAVHLWADVKRKEMFETPLHTYEESRALYAHLNQETALLLADGKSVIFDTNFNFYKDRQYLREIAAQNNARTKLLWVQAPKELAYERATQKSHGQATRIFGNMSHEDFERIAGHLESPRDNEEAIILDGTKITREYVIEKIGLKDSL